MSGRGNEHGKGMRHAAGCGSKKAMRKARKRTVGHGKRIAQGRRPR